MNVLSIARDAYRTAKGNRALWFFGFFVASTGGTGFKYSRSAGETPSWLLPALAATAALALAALVLHVVSESALIDGVRRTRRGESYSMRTGMRTGFGLFWRMAGLKLGALGVALATVAIAALPLAVVLLAGGPAWAGAIGTAVLTVVLLPWMLSVYFVYELSMRVLVVEDASVVGAVREGFGFLHGRVASSLGLLLASGVGELVTGALGALVAIPIVAIAGLVYLAAGLVPALVCGGVLLAPVAIGLTGALGTYRSSVWTHAYLEERGLRA